MHFWAIYGNHVDDIDHSGTISKVVGTENQGFAQATKNNTPTGLTPSRAFAFSVQSFPYSAIMSEPNPDDVGLRRRRIAGRGAPVRVPRPRRRRQSSVTRSAGARSNPNSPALAAWTSPRAVQFSRRYCWVSALCAALAVLTAPASSPRHAVTGAAGGGGLALVEYTAGTTSIQNRDSTPQLEHPSAADASFWGNIWDKPHEQQPKDTVITRGVGKQPPMWLRWILQQHKNNNESVTASSETSRLPWFLDIFSNSNNEKAAQTEKKANDWMFRWLDPKILYPDKDTFTDLIDKVLTSSVRLFLIANFFMALTLLLHSAVADLFLGNGNGSDESDDSSRRDGDQQAHRGERLPAAFPPMPDPQRASGGRERLGGFLVFKLLLISAVVAPDTLDLLILLSWYTVLSFLRSLAALCAQQTDTVRVVGQAPAAGVWKLLATVLCLDVIAASLCVALFHGAGLGMVLLLTCDCALLAVDVVTHILLHLQLLWDVQHSDQTEWLEDEQLERHQHDTDRRERRETPLVDRIVADEVSESLDRNMEAFERQHLRRMALLESTIFGLQLVTDLLTVAHFVHIWTLHGVQFSLIDGVLALHLHSALSSASKRIVERRNTYRIARDMDGIFEDASELDLRKAAATGDVCCICLGTMSCIHVSSGSSSSSGTINYKNVKKVACGHLYHTVCLREVVERARSVEAARCPLCRSYVVDDHRRSNSLRDAVISTRAPALTATEDPDVSAEGDGDFPRAFRDPINTRNRESDNNDGAAIAGAGERALFRFSTEGVFPAWVPLPAFSFEVVRRPPLVASIVAGGNAAARNAIDAVDTNSVNGNEGRDEEAPQHPQASLLRRLLLLAGVIPMSPAEERSALDQLVDMFPQYDRQDLIRALREHISSEAVAESILAGTFVGAPLLGAR